MVARDAAWDAVQAQLRARAPPPRAPPPPAPSAPAAALLILHTEL